MGEPLTRAALLTGRWHTLWFLDVDEEIVFSIIGQSKSTVTLCFCTRYLAREYIAQKNVERVVHADEQCRCRNWLIEDLGTTSDLISESFAGLEIYSEILSKLDLPPVLADGLERHPYDNQTSSALSTRPRVQTV